MCVRTERVDEDISFMYPESWGMQYFTIRDAVDAASETS